VILAAVAALSFQCPDGAPPPCRGARVAPAANSVAVLPFENRARDTSMTFLAEGLADEITTNLGRISRLRVSSPSSVRYAVDRGPREPRRVGNALSVRWLVDGQLQSGRGAARVSVQLIDAATGTVRWSNSFQRSTDDLLGLISSVADTVARSIVGELAPGERAQLAARPTTSASAYEAYLRGRFLLSQGGENYLAGGAMFDAAVAADSNFAEAWAASASAFISIADNILAPRDAYPRARANAAHALRIDPSNGEATAALAKIALWYDWDLPGSLRLARRAVALNPASPETHIVLGLSLILRGDTAAADAELKRAIDLDSLSGRTLSSASFGLGAILGDSAAAAGRARRFLAGGPHSLYDSMVVMRILDGGGHCADVEALLGNSARRVPGVNRCRPWTVAQIDSVIVVQRATTPYVRAWSLARSYVQSGNADKAIEQLEQAFRDREAWMPFIQYDAGFRPLYTDPRFRDLVRRVAASVGAG